MRKGTGEVQGIKNDPCVTLSLFPDQRGKLNWTSLFGSIDMDEVDDEGNYALKHNQGYLLAHSFDEFLTRLARYPDDISQSG